MLPTTTLSDRPRSRVDFQPLVRLRALGKEALSRLAVPAAVLAAGWSLAAFTGTGGGAAETEYLTFLATGVLTAAALMAPRPGTALGLGGTLAVLVLWVVPPGPSRGAGLTAMLLTLLVLAAVRCWGPAWAPSDRAAPTFAANGGPAAARLWMSAFATVFGFQVLMGAEDLLNPGPDPVTVGRFLLLPAVAATALAVLVRFAGPVPALIAGAAAATAGGGWGAGPVLTLTALAGGAVLATPVPRSGPEWAPVWLVRSVAGIALVAPLVWQQRAGAIAAAAGLALALADPAPSDAREAPPRDPRWLRTSLPLLPVVAVLVGSAVMPLHPWRQAVAGVLWLPVLLPALLFPALLAAVRGRSVLTLAAMGLALAAGRGTPEPSILAAPVALAALSLPTIARSVSRSDPRSGLRWDRAGGAAAGLQGIWSLALLAATTLAVTYPWLRPGPPAVAASWLGLAPFGPSASGDGSGLGSGALAGLQPAAPLLALVPLFLLASLSRWLSPRRLAFGLGLALALLLVAHLPSAPQTVLHPGGRQILDLQNPELHLPLDGTEIRQVVLDSHLTHAGELLSGVTVAVLRLEDGSGASLEWPIRMGEETGEWAAARPDLARRPSLVTPPPWLSQVVESPDDEWRGGDTVDGERETWDDEMGRRFFAYRYRTVLEVERAAGTAHGESPRGRLREPVRLLLRRSRALPPDVTLAVFHLETRP